MIRIDYCNSLFAAAPVYQTDQLQRVLNSAARLLLRVPKSDWKLRTKVRDRLHWLRAPKIVSYKLCTLVYKALHNIAPRYLAELCVPIVTDAYRSHLWSADRKELKVSRHNLSTYDQILSESQDQWCGTLSRSIFEMRTYRTNSFQADWNHYCSAFPMICN